MPFTLYSLKVFIAQFLPESLQSNNCSARRIFSVFFTECTRYNADHLAAFCDMSLFSKSVPYLNFKSLNINIFHHVTQKTSYLFDRVYVHKYTPICMSFIELVYPFFCSIRPFPPASPLTLKYWDDARIRASLFHWRAYATLLHPSHHGQLLW